MSVTVDLFRAKFPEFFLASDEAISQSIFEATFIMGDNVDRWLGEEGYFLANVHLSAHFLYVSSGSSGGDSNPLAPIKRTSVDNVEIDYAINSMASDGEEFLGTMYGRRYIMYRKMCFSGWCVA